MSLVSLLDQDLISDVNRQVLSPAEELISEKPLGEEDAPITAETTTITTGKAPSKPRKKKKTPSVRQSVKINIIASPRAIGQQLINKKYIKNEMLC